MAWWSRGARGRHALGAAVTSIPSGPLVLPVAVPVAPAAPVTPAEPSLEELLAQYGHLLHDVPPEPVPTPDPTPSPDPTAAPEPAPAPAPASEREPAAARVQGYDPVEDLPTGPVPSLAAPETPEPDGLAWLSAVLAGEEPEPPVVVVPVQAPPPFVPPGPPVLDPSLLQVGAVQLGFRDGSTASLAPEQAQALQDLARSLTSSD